MLDKLILTTKKIFNNLWLRVIISLGVILLIIILSNNETSFMINRLLFLSPILFVFVFIPSSRINNFLVFIMLALTYLFVNYISLYVVGNEPFYWSGLLLIFIVSIFAFVIPTFLLSMLFSFVKNSSK